MQISLIAVGTRMPAWVSEGYHEYQRRLGGGVNLKLVELGLGHRGKSASVERAIAQEGDAMLQAIPDGDRVVALDLSGRSWSTEQLAGRLSDWMMDGRNVSLLVGGPDGLDPRCLQRAQERWCLSALTLPHPLVRILVAEQLYRAWSLNNNHPYHR